MHVYCPYDVILFEQLLYSDVFLESHVCQESQVINQSLEQTKWITRLMLSPPRTLKL